MEPLRTLLLGIDGPFGRTQGDAFNATVPNNGNIVGFFGRSGSNLDAIGVYTI
jgi:hypothetical protein